MKKLRIFGYSLINSSTSLDYYYDIIQAKILFSLKYFVFFSFFYASLNAIHLYVNYIQPLKPVIAGLPMELSQVYPEDLVITVQNGEVNINQEQPYFIPADRLRQVLYNIKDQVLGADSRSVDFLLVVDTEADIQDFYEYNTFSLLTKNALIYLDPGYRAGGDGQIKVKAIPLTGVNAYFNQAVVKTILENFVPYAQRLLPASLLFLFLGSLLVLPYLHLVYIGIMSFVTLFIVKILDLNLDYSRAFQIGIHLFCSILLFTYILRLLGLMPPLPLIKTSIFVIAMIAILVHIKELSRRKRKALKVKS